MTNRSLVSTPVIVIIGGGFCGMITAVHLCQKAQAPLHIKIINKGNPFAKGVAYSTYSKEHLLNVRAKGMSAFANEPAHFVQWLLQQPAYKNADASLLGNEFLPRIVYGEYLSHIWQQTLAAKPGRVSVEVITDTAIDIVHCVKGYHVICENSEPVIADAIVLATGNGQPRLPAGIAPQYDCNPWTHDSVKEVAAYNNILIAGNGLTMADTVLGLRENGFQGVIHTISPNGYALKPHVDPHLSYSLPEEAVLACATLQQWKQLIYQQIYLARKAGLPKEVVIDALRPYSIQAWQQFSLVDKQQFIKQLGHHWNVLRHRLPTQIHANLQQQQQQQLIIPRKGMIMQSQPDHNNHIQVTLFNAHTKAHDQLTVQRIINCTGPDTNITGSSNPLLCNLEERGLITHGPLQIGIAVNNSNFSVISKEGYNHPHLAVIGSNLKGLLWESTAVPELRNQCSQVAQHLLKQVMVKEKARV